ncbi:MAG TPA: pyridoxal-dependent decarboxylase [Kineosporiaceae bacterium]|nr:pyridoxal-dependent decarboxylase [Kineosporiaceae bacterium]
MNTLRLDDLRASPSVHSAVKLGVPAIPLELSEVFASETFRTMARSTVDLLAEHISDDLVRGLDLADPDRLTALARGLMTTERDVVAPLDEDRLAAILDLYVRTGIQVHSPGAMGRQFSGTLPLAGVVELVGAVTNQPSSFYEAAQLPSVAERIMADELNQFIGWQSGSFAMVTTSGGSLANLTALAAARNKRFPRFWTEGAAGGSAGGRRPAVAVGDDVHYSVTRAVGILGIGEDQLVRLPLNRARQISVELAGPVLDAAARRGLDVFALVATAGTTSVGAFDPLDGLADLAAARDLWLHVDAAHGGGLLVSDEYRHLLHGVRRVDSIAVDAHKMMFVPAPCTLLFYRDAEDSRRPFRQDASYVFDEEPDVYTRLDSGDRNFECTKRPMIMALWVLWAMHGPAVFAGKVDHLCRVTSAAHDVLLDETDFEACHRPEANILCFRYLPPNLPETAVHSLQLAIRNRIKEHGKFFLSKVDLDGTAALRVVMMNHRTTVEHFRLLLAEIRAVAAHLLPHPTG